VSGQRHESYDVRELRVLLKHLNERIDGVEDRIGRLEERVERELRALWAQTPAARQAQHEADLAAADLAESGYADDPPVGADRHGPGCLCPYCPDEEEEAVQ
jgi:hypothetical protein